MANIKLNNKTYPIPDSKLATATAGFLAHLRTIAGNGLKVVVGGVEYGVDSTKLSGAVSELVGAFDELENGGSGDSDSVVGTWVFNETLDITLDGVYQVRVKKLHDEYEYIGLIFYRDDEVFGLLTELPDNYGDLYEAGDWLGEREITFLEEPPAEVGTWIRANAVKIEVEFIPEGGVYTTVDGIIYNEGEPFPMTIAKGDIYKYGDYEYCYGYAYCGGCEEWSHLCGDDLETDGWAVRCINDVAVPDAILNDINGEPITSLQETFFGYTSLETAPEIPDSVTNMFDTFASCTSLTTAPEIPNSVTNMSYTFVGCTALTTAPEIPDSVTDMNGTFLRCTSLTTAPEIPNSVTDMNGTFNGCTSLTTAPEIPDSVTNMNDTFNGCTSLTIAPEIPNSVTNMSYTFVNCTALTTAPEIPDSVTDMSSTFVDCTALTTAPEIPDSVTDMSDTFLRCTSLTTAPEIPNSVTDMWNTFFDCTSLTGTIVINANPTRYKDCFKNTTKPITLTGSSNKLTLIAATANNGNVTVQ